MVERQNDTPTDAEPFSDEIYPSSFQCACGHRSDFFENTVRELKKLSKKKEARLGDSEQPFEHTVLFRFGRFVGIDCPKLKRVVPRRPMPDGL